MEKTYNFVGIGGIGMSAIAKILLESKNRVKGSDLQTNGMIEELKKKGAQIKIGHKSQNVEACDVLVVSSAIGKDNPEYIKAKSLNLCIMHRSELLQALMKDKKQLVITGTHGKTTTTALLTSVLLENKQDPSFVIGGLLNSLKTNAHLGKDDFFVVEADESDGSFLKTTPNLAIVTNLEKEHLNYWKSFKNLKQGFLSFFDKVLEDNLFWCIEDENLRQINPKGISYGFLKEACIRAENIKSQGFQIAFDINYFGKVFKNFKLNLVGEHNVLNALGVFGLCMKLNIHPDVIKKAFEVFCGTARRLEKIGVANEVLFLDDYAHHPTEIKSTLQALKKASEEKRIIAVFQPHRYTRVKDLLKEFTKAFFSVDKLIITNIYSAKEEPIKNINEQLLVDLIKKQGVDVEHIKDEDLQSYILKNAYPFDVIVALGAGDISLKIRKIFSSFKTIKKKIKVGIIYGGRSNEHDISIRSKNNYSNAFDKDLYELKDFYIDKRGFWSLEVEKSKEVFSKDILKQLFSCDLCFPIMHGPQGEDGMIAAFLQTLNIPYIGSDFFTSAVAMDKAFCKIIVNKEKVPIVDFFQIINIDWIENSQRCLEQTMQKIKFPMYVKPNHFGSSIGICIVKDKNELKKAIEEILKEDSSLIIEPQIFAKEIQASVIGNEYIKIGQIGEMKTEGKFFDYDNKYNKSVVTACIPANLDADIMDKIKKYSLLVYKQLKITGLCRIDFFVDQNKNIFFNEVNPIPGFTSMNSLFPKMLEHIGIDNKTMMNLLVIYALHRQRKLSRIKI